MLIFKQPSQNKRFWSLLLQKISLCKFGQLEEDPRHVQDGTVNEPWLLLYKNPDCCCKLPLNFNIDLSAASEICLRNSPKIRAPSPLKFTNRGCLQPPKISKKYIRLQKCLLLRFTQTAPAFSSVDCSSEICISQTSEFFLRALFKIHTSKWNLLGYL